MGGQNSILGSSKWVIRIFILLAAVLLLSSCKCSADFTQEEIDAVKVTLWGITCRKWPTVIILLCGVILCCCVAQPWWDEGSIFEDKLNLYDVAGNIIGAIGTGIFHETEGGYDRMTGPMTGGLIFTFILYFLNYGFGGMFRPEPFVLNDWNALGLLALAAIHGLIWAIPYLGAVIRYAEYLAAIVFAVALIFTPLDAEQTMPNNITKTESSVISSSNKKSSSSPKSRQNKDISSDNGVNEDTKTFEKVWSWTKDKASDISSFAKDEFNDVTTSIDEKIDKKKEQRAQKKATAKNSEDRIEKDNDSIGIIQKVSLWFRQLSQKQDQ